MSLRSLPRLLVITDEEACAFWGGRSVIDAVRDVLAGAVNARDVCVLVRHKRGTRDDVRALCERLLPIVRGAGALLVVHGDVALVGEGGLDGVHLDGRATREDLHRARALLPADSVLSCSRHAGDALNDDALGPADIVTLSPVFAPTSKPADARTPLGIDGLCTLAATSARPAWGLGGITVDNARAVVGARAHGVAVMGGLWQSQHPVATFTGLREALRR